MEIQQMQIAMVLSRKIVLILAAFKVMQKKKKRTQRNWESEKKTTQFRCFYFLEELAFSLNEIAHVKSVIPTKFSVSFLRN